MCRYDRRKRYSENDWRVTHAAYLQQWDQRQRFDPEDGAAHRHNHYVAYLRWYHSVTRAFVKPPSVNPTVPIEDRADTDDEADDITDDYDRLIREGLEPERGPLQSYMVSVSFSINALFSNSYVLFVIDHYNYFAGTTTQPSRK